MLISAAEILGQITVSNTLSHVGSVSGLFIGEVSVLFED